MRGTAELGGVAASAPVGNAMRLVAIGDQGRDVLARLDRIELGERMPAFLRSRFPDGSFEVELAGTSLRMTLPAGMQVGQKIDLSLVGRQPRPTFMLQGFDASARAEVSQAGRLIDALLRPERSDSTPAKPFRALVDAARPVATAPLTQSEPLARALASALSSSGVFYESHVAQWVTGTRSLQQLQQEPQYNWTDDNLSRPQAGSNAGAASGTGSATGSAGASAAPAAAASSATASATVSAAASAAFAAQAAANGPALNAANADSLAASGAASPPALNIDPASEAAQMMRLQLETLEQSQVLWRGEAWPGLPMEWGVADDGGAGAVTGERSWQSVLRFHFDKLGTVAATISLSGGQVQLSLRAESEDVAKQLRGGAAGLADAMREAGTPLHLMTVRQEKAP